MRLLLASLVLLLATPASAQPDSTRTVEFIELASQRAGLGAMDSLRLNLSGEYDPDRSTLHVAGTTVVESPNGETRPARAIVRLHLNKHEKMIPDALVNHVGLCGAGIEWYQVYAISNADGSFSIALPIGDDQLAETLHCLSIRATTTDGRDAVGAVAYGVVR